MTADSQQSAWRMQVHIPADRVTIAGDIVVPEGSGGIVVFGQGIASELVKTANEHLARRLQQAGLATLMIGLLTPEEEDLDARTEGMRFDVNLLSRRLISSTWWLKDQTQTAELAIGYFALGTDAGAALVSAAEATDLVDAVVCVNGHPDLAGTALAKVIAPTLLVIGESDANLREHNETAFEQLSGQKNIEILPNNDNLQDSATLERTYELSQRWFARYLLGDVDDSRAA